MGDPRLSRRNLLRTTLGLAVAPALATVLAACGQSTPRAPAASGGAAKPAESKPAEAKPAEAAKPAAGAPAAKAGGELVYLNQSRGQLKAMEALAARYTEQTGVKVTIDSPGPTDYPQKLQAAANAGNLPDAYYAIGAADMAPYFKAGWALNLKPEMDKGWNKNFVARPARLRRVPAGQPGRHPGRHLPGAVGGQHLRRRSTTRPSSRRPAWIRRSRPTTTAELLDMSKKLKAANLGPFVVPSTYIPWFTESLRLELAEGRGDRRDARRQGARTRPTPGRTRSSTSSTCATPNVDLQQHAEPDDARPREVVLQRPGGGVFWTSVVSIPVQVTTAPDFTAYSAFPLPKVAERHDGPAHLRRAPARTAWSTPRARTSTSRSSTSSG